MTDVNQFEPWQRVHISTPLVRAGRGAIALLVIFASSFNPSNQTNDEANLIIHMTFLVIVLVFGFAQWRMTRWRIEDGTLRIESGVISRNSLRFPLDQIQAVDTVRSGLARIFGVSELRLRMASNTHKEGRLAYLHASHAETVRARLLALAHGVEEHTPPPPEYHLLSVPTPRLLGSLVLSSIGVVVLALVGSLFILATYSWKLAFSAIGGTVPLLTGIAVGSWRRFNSGYRMTVAEAPDGFRIRSGLVETTAETIPRARIQAVRMSEPLVWRLFGWCRLEVSVAGKQRRKGENKSESRPLRQVLPVAKKVEAQWLVDRIVPDAPKTPALKPPLRARVKAPLSFHFLSWQRNDTCAITTHGRLEKVTDWVPLARVQSVRVLQGPVQRRLKLANIHLDIAGRDIHAKLTDRAADEIADVVEELIEKCRATRVSLRTPETS